MAVHENRKGEVTATLSEMRVWTSLGTRTLYEALRDLQDAGFISVVTPFQHVANSSATFALSWGSAATAEPVRQQPQNLVSENGQSDHLDTRRVGGNELSEIPSPLNNPPPNPPPVLSPVLSLSSVLENEELGQEGISITRDGQGELISTETPAWLTNLRTTPSYDLDAAHEQRLIQRVGNTAISTQRLCETSAAIAAKWESVRWSPSNKRGYKRIDLTFYAWANRKEVDRGTSQNRGLDVIPDRLEAYRRSYGRYMKVTP